MAKIDPAIQAHLDWLGFVQPHGLVVSAPALAHAGAILNRNDIEGQGLLRDCVEERVVKEGEDTEPWIPDFESFARSVLGWQFAPRAFERVTDSASAPSELVVRLPEHDEILRPDYAIRHWPPRTNGEPAWQLLVRVVAPAQEFDALESGEGVLEASTHSKMERLVRATRASAGVIFNGKAIRLLSAPHGESSGWMDFRVADMLQTPGRPIVAALRLLLGQNRLLTLPVEERLPALLAKSRDYQNVVSERLAEQVLHALYELLRGFQAANEKTDGTLLRDELEQSPNTVYRALLTVILRLVFLLYAEQRDLLPSDETFVRYYSLAGLHDRLREDAAQNPDTMDERYGAWAQLIVLFKMIHSGGKSGNMYLPPRHGALFDPNLFLFLQIAPPNAECSDGEDSDNPPVIPRVPDGTVYRVLEKLLVLDGERISYRALDVEQIGSVYETMMGFRLEIATGISIAIKAPKKGGAPSTVDIEQLLAEAPQRRRKWIQDRTARKITDRVNRAVCEAVNIDGVYAALEPVVDKHATPDRVPGGSMILQPSEERRRSGSHYTPRALTEPIVRKTLGPILDGIRERCGGQLTADQILELKVCDPAMGSGAFLVEACRQLGDALVDVWKANKSQPVDVADEDLVIAARRMVAQQCLYGVDRNVVAVDLAKMSLWLVTLSKNEPLTFVDHALRHGDSLLGLTREQIWAFHWRGGEKLFAVDLVSERIRRCLQEIKDNREKIREASISTDQKKLKGYWKSVTSALTDIKLIGDIVLEVHFTRSSDRAREVALRKYGKSILAGDILGTENPLDALRIAEKPLASFHWQIEFPEVFERHSSGFDCIVGNPPFAGKNSIIAANMAGYTSWLRAMHPQSHGNSDLAAHFFRRSFSLLREGGNLGLIATNTIAQGDTRSTGLRWICTNGGEIYDATRRLQWPGLAAVVVSVVHIHRGRWTGPTKLDGQILAAISAFLVQGTVHEDPAKLIENENQSFVGSFVLGMGFTFDDTDKKGIASSLAEMRRIIDHDPNNEQAIMPYIGGEELNTDPTHAHHRYVINFYDYPLKRDPKLRQSWFKATEKQRKKWLSVGVVPFNYPKPVAEDWPEILGIVKAKVRPERIQKNRKAVRERWWQYAEKCPGLYRSIKGMDRVLATSIVGQHHAFSFLSNDRVFANRLIIFPVDTYASFSALQCRIHEIWASHFGSTLKDDICYTPSDCFENYPFPLNWRINSNLEGIGSLYFRHRSDLMVQNNEGLTKTYNRFHDRYENNPDIVRLRELHAEMDRAVLTAYGWDDIPCECDFFRDYGSEGDVDVPKRFWRYRWPDEVSDKVLGRLIELNAERKEAESEADGCDTPLTELQPQVEVEPEQHSDKEPPPLFAGIND